MIDMLKAYFATGDLVEVTRVMLVGWWEQKKKKKKLFWHIKLVL